MIGEGDSAPDFTLQGVSGDGEEVTVTLSEIDEPVALYFYPKDDTPGCTTQACGIRDEWSVLENADARILGVSPDDIPSHRKFSEKYDLPFTILSDPEGEVAEAYGVWKEKKMFGNTFMGVERSTFIIDGDGRVTDVWRKVKAKKHTDQLLEVLA
ncbi:MAG: thioredoxin-dependent thiol peroxidase [Longimicrobiales bacterium]